MYRKFIHIFPSDILSVTFFRLLLTIKRYYNNRWSFWPGGGRIPTPVICRVPPGFLGSNFDQVITRGRGGGGILPKFYAGRFRPEVQSLTLLYTIFDRKGPLSFTVY